MNEHVEVQCGAPGKGVASRVTVLASVLTDSIPCRSRERHCEETLNFVEKASSSLTRNFGRRRSWMA